jgi:hypothetical protein
VCTGLAVLADEALNFAQSPQRVDFTALVTTVLVGGQSLAVQVSDVDQKPKS